MSNDIIDLDTRGLRCPLPVLRLEKVLRDVEGGQTIRIVADDPIAKVDIPHFVAEAGHRCVTEKTENPEECVFQVTKCAVNPSA
ncbi:MAG: sulfurtransferase TusA family protein [Pseudomonadota bacterium]